MKYFLVAFIFLLNLELSAQMKTLDELINKNDPGWTFVKAWIDSAKNAVEILPVDTSKAREALYKTQVTTRSPMGAIIYMTGGLLIDHGWIRILGSGSEKLSRSLPDWNEKNSQDSSGESLGFYLVADDVLGGFFALNGGSLGKDFGKIYYLAPDNLEWEPLDLTYSDFLLFCFNNNLDDFYKPYRWKGWEKDVSNLAGDRAYHILPPLWAKEGKDITKDSKKDVPIQELFSLTFDFRKQLGVK